jgi:hypothetical protein
VERVALWRCLAQASPTSRALVTKTRARTGGAAEDKSAISKRYSRTTSIEGIEGGAAWASDQGHTDDVGVRAAPSIIDVVFVDESHDLTVVDLEMPKPLCRRGAVMEGEAGQAIYGLGSSNKPGAATSAAA